MSSISLEKIRQIMDTGNSIAAFCNQVPYDSSELSTALNNASVSLASLIAEELDETGIIEVFKMLHKIDDTKDILTLTIQYQIGDTEDRAVFKVEREGYDDFLMSFTKTINNIIEGNIAIDKLNKKISSKQEELGTETAIEYLWGNDRYCKVHDWDYDKLRIKLSSAAVKQLILLNKNNELDNIVYQQKWNISITKYLEGFSKMPLHERINAVMEYDDIDTLLTDNMLSSEDILPIVKVSQEKNITGVQKVKIVSIIKELGHFTVVYLASIDYEKKTISLQIMSDKVYDLTRGRFISDRDIVSRVEDKIEIGKETVARIFIS